MRLALDARKAPFLALASSNLATATMKKEGLIPLNIEKLYVTRLVLMLETEPQSNSYKQVLITKEQFRKMSDALFDCHEQNILGEIGMLLADDSIELSPDFKDFIE